MEIRPARSADSLSLLFLLTEVIQDSVNRVTAAREEKTLLPHQVI